MNITIGVWIFPLIITLVTIGYVVLKPSSKGYMAGVEVIWELPIAISVSLGAWLAWALFFK